jgi:SPP1 gp7 family putative phage head morphogenesis protein
LKIGKTASNDLLGAIDAVLGHVGILKAGGKQVGPPTVLSTERKLVSRLLKGWKGETKKAIEDAARAFSKGSGDVSKEDVANAVEAMRKRLGPEFAKLTATDVEKYMRAAYTLGRTVMARKLGIKPNWSMIDEKAREWCAENTTYWIGNHYDDQLGQTIAKAIDEEVLQSGLGRVEAGQKLREVLGDRFLRSEVYWRGLAANAINRARNFGGVQSMVDAEVEEYRIIAVMDARTSSICREMDGKVFRTEHAVKIRDDMIGAKDPEAVKAIAPWRDADEVKGKDADALAKLGMALPPYHYHCRSSYVVNAFRRSRGGAPKVEDATTPTPTTEPQQEPKKRTAKEIIASITGAYAQDVKLPGVTDEMMADIEDGMYAVFGDKYMNLKTIRWTTSKQANAMYEYYPRLTPENNIGRDSIAINKEYAKDARALAAMRHKNWKDNNANMIRIAEGTPTTDHEITMKPLYQKKLADLKATKRWTISNASKNPLRATVTHEAGHAIYYRSYVDNVGGERLMVAWGKACLKFKRSDILAVSEYAASSASEMWAEVTSAYHSEYRDEIPKDIKDAYEDLLKRAKVVR